MAYNPVINVYRRMATEVRTEDESPLTLADLGLARKYFPNVQHREFWISTLLLFVKYYVVDRVHPNQDRYWKRILRETPQSLRWWVPLRALDAALTRLPLVRWLAWNMVMWGEKEAPRAEASLDTPMLNQIRIDRRVFYAFMISMFVVNARCLFVSWGEIMAGENDFPPFYASAQMVREGQASRLYDFEVENSFVHRHRVGNHGRRTTTCLTKFYFSCLLPFAIRNSLRTVDLA